MKLYIIGFSKDYDNKYKKITRYFRILLENKKTVEEDGKKYVDTLYKVLTVDEPTFVKEVNSKKYALVNAAIENGAVVNKTGDLNRFNNGQNRPLVILAEIRNENDVLLGYRLANYQGRVNNLTLKQTLEYCNKASMTGGVPIQNAMYIAPTSSKGAFIRSYPNGDFDIQHVKVGKNKYSKPASIDKKENEKVVKKSKLEDLFSQEQIAELKKAKAAGVDIRIIGNNKLSPKQMQVIWEAERDGLRGRLFADPAYDVSHMEFYRAELDCKSDISQILNPKYSLEQMFEISLGIEQGVDITKYANPKNSAKEMATIRTDLYNKLWRDYKVFTGSLDNLK